MNPKLICLLGFVSFSAFSQSGAGTDTTKTEKPVATIFQTGTVLPSAKMGFIEVKLGAFYKRPCHWIGLTAAFQNEAVSIALDTVVFRITRMPVYFSNLVFISRPASANRVFLKADIALASGSSLSSKINGQKKRTQTESNSSLMANIGIGLLANQVFLFEAGYKRLPSLRINDYRREDLFYINAGFVF